MLGVWQWSSERQKGEVVKKEVAKEKVEVKELRFGVMADIHSDIRHLERALKLTKERGLEFVVVAGDLTKVGAVEELTAVRKALMESGLKYYVIPGNHDRDKKAFVGLFGETYQSFKKGEVKFILVDNSGWRGLGVEQRSWLDNEVQECRIIQCLVVMHMPLNHGFSEHIMGEDNEKVTTEAKEILVLLRDNGVKEIIAGHLHYASSYELEGIRTNLAGAINGFKFTEFGVGISGIRREVHDIGN